MRRVGVPKKTKAQLTAEAKKDEEAKKAEEAKKE